MKLIDKLLFGVLCVLTIAIGLVLIAAAIGFPLDASRIQTATAALENPWIALFISLLALALIALCVRLLYVLVRGENDGKRSVAIQKSESGASFMTVNALNAMVSRYIRSDDRISNAKTSVKSNGDAVSITARISAKADAAIPAMTEQLQNSIKSHIETYSGAKVDKVEVIVESTESSATEGRVS